jgi:hypothetical protein
MKTLYVLCSNGGDGSSYPRFTFNKEWIDMMQTMCDSGHPDFDYEGWADGDGFHYEKLTVPDECTLESLGIRYDCAQND